MARQLLQRPIRRFARFLIFLLRVKAACYLSAVNGFLHALGSMCMYVLDPESDLGGIAWFSGLRNRVAV